MNRVADRWALVTRLTIGLPLLGCAVACVDAIRHGVAPLYLELLVVFYVIGAFGTETGFHRLLSHRAFRARSVPLVLLCIAGSIAAQGTPLFWVTCHRHHHAHTDSVGDPHSPYPLSGSAPAAARSKPRPTWRGLLHAHVGWLLAGVPRDVRPNVNDLLREPIVMSMSRLYPLWVLLGLALPALIAWGTLGTIESAVRGLLWGGLVRIAVWQHVTWSVNSVGHAFGTRTFATKDNSVNSPWLVPLTFGGAWHNNHHAFPSSAKVGLMPGQIDLHYWLIRLLEQLGFASHIRVPTAASLQLARRKGKMIDEPA
jgi:stearoyl-CoA desaturase (delta-9 desaturase)